MDPCSFVRVLVGNLALRMPVAPPTAGAGVAGAEPTTLKQQRPAEIDGSNGAGRRRRRREGEEGVVSETVTVHDLSGSPVALASMVTPFVASRGTDRVSRSNPGAWLILHPAGDGSWEPWGRLECWRERGGAGACDSLGYCFDLLLPGVDHAVPLAESSIGASKGGKFAIDLTSMQPQSRGGLWSRRR